MQIKNVKIENLKSLESKTFNPEKITVFVGKNGAGKSTCLDAIRFALTGKAPSNPVRTGATSATVECDILGSTLTRTVGKKTTVKMDGKSTTQKSVQKFIEDATGITNDTIRVVTSANILASMDAGKLADYLVTNGLIPAEIDFDKFKALYPLSKEAEEEISMMFPVAPVKFGMDDIEVAYTQYYGSRPILKKELAEKKIIAEFVKEGRPKRSVKQIDAELQKFIAHTAEVNAYQKLLKAYEAAEKNRADVLGKISKIEEQIRTLPSVTVDPKEREFLVSQSERLREKMIAEAKTGQIISANIEMFKKTLDNLGRPVCPISNKLICTTDKTEIKDELTKAISDNDAELVKARERYSELKGQLDSITTKIKDYDSRYAQYQKIQTLHSQRTALKTAIPAIPEKPVKPADIENEAEEKAKLNEERNTAIKYDNALKAQADIEIIEKKLVVLNEIITALSPKGGVREKIIEVALSPLVDHCNARAAELKTDFKIGMEASEGVTITCSPDATKIEMLPIESISSGEQVYALMLIMDALNSLSGLGILVLDDLDKLDKGALENLFGLLSNPDVTKPYDHIFLAMVDHKDSIEVIKKFDSIIDETICM